MGSLCRGGVALGGVAALSVMAPSCSKLEVVSIDAVIMSIDTLSSS